MVQEEWESDNALEYKMVCVGGRGDLPECYKNERYLTVGYAHGRLR